MPDSVTPRDPLDAASDTDALSVVAGQETVDADDGGGTEQDGQGTTQVNWDDPSNPYLARFKGLQSTVQSYSERTKQLEGQLTAMQWEMMQSRVADLPEDEAKFALEAFRADLSLQQREQQVSQAYQTVGEVAKAATINQIASQYRIKPEDLAQFDSPQAMETHARAIAAERKRAAKAERARTGADKFDGGGGGAVAPPKEKPKSLKEARERFASRVINR